MGTIEIKDEGPHVLITVHDGTNRFINRVSGTEYSEAGDAARELARLNGIYPAAMATFATMAEVANDILVNSKNEMQRADASVVLATVGSCAAMLGKAWRTSKGR